MVTNHHRDHFSPPRVQVEADNFHCVPLCVQGCLFCFVFFWTTLSCQLTLAASCRDLSSNLLPCTNSMASIPHADVKIHTPSLLRETISYHQKATEGLALILTSLFPGNLFISRIHQLSAPSCKFNSAFKRMLRGTWMVQSVKRQTLDLSSGHDLSLWVHVRDSTLTVWSLLGIFSARPPTCLSPLSK